MAPRPRFLSFASGVPAAAGDGHEKPSPLLPMLALPESARNNFVAVIGEFVGTFLFLFFAFAGTQIATDPSSSSESLTTLIFIALAFGVSLTANVWAFYRVTGGLFNPAVTLALFLVGGLPGLRSVFVIISQLLGGIAAAAVVSGLFPGPMGVATTLGRGTSVTQGLFIEMFLTAELVFVIIMVAAEKHKGTYLAPVAIGIAFFLTQLVGVTFTGGSLNPARSLGPAAVSASFPGYFWIYVLGPILGALLASAFYSLLKYLRWKECNPGQDWDDIENLRNHKHGVRSGNSVGVDPLQAGEDEGEGRQDGAVQSGVQGV
ncbi:aquaporin-2 [Echria macrotheca]|uniref:Aquaporin-2 n=1 Tax=Echria macrotheca TaxID=438768 RepID=A0AAJ0BGT1_9PEZI|nr:aquaporin-2 [Echria macrotheca]